MFKYLTVLIFLVSIPLFASEQEIDNIVKSFIKTNKFQGNVLVAKKNEIIFEKSYGMAHYEHSIPNRFDSKFIIGSLSKHFTAAAILYLQEDGLLNVYDHISKYLEVPDSWRDIRVQHLLTHSSGLQGGKKEVPLMDSEYAQYHSLKTLFDSIVTFPLIKDHKLGIQFQYSNAGYMILAHLVETISGMTFNDFLQKYIFEAGKFENSGIYHQNLILKNRAEGYVYFEDILYRECCFDYSNAVGAGSVYSTTRDLLRWDKKLRSFDVLSKFSVESMYWPYIKAPAFGKNSYYGLGLVIDKWNNKDIIWHNGAVNGYRSDFIRFIEDELVIIILSNKGEAPLVEYLSKIRNQIAKVLFAEKKK